MKKIIRIHEKVLDHLLDLHKLDNRFYFVPRKINNKKRRDKGYWFLGNDHYLHLSFWNGTDWKEKIHNIGLVILSDRTSYIELSAQDSPEKAIFLKKIASKLPGFKKDGNKNKWHKRYSGTNYIENLNDFIQNFKPVIDELIKTENPNDIRLLNESFFNKYTKKIIALREEQIEVGTINKLSRICWNTENWKFPSGSQGKSFATDSYESNYGFGYEEWLFDKFKIVDEYHYAFLQPLFLKTGKHENKNYNISLLTINNLNKKYFAGEIRNVECITREESERVFHIYKQKGWIDQMKNDVLKVGANHHKLNEAEPHTFFNIRFQFKDVSLPEDLIEIATDDINITTSRYKLLPQKAQIGLQPMHEEGSEPEGNHKNTKKRKKVFNVDCEYDPYHDQMQNAIFDLLKNSDQYNYKKVFIEKGRVDIKAITNENTCHYFELKTCNAKQSIRLALGQILEYAYFPENELAEKLIIIADDKPSENVVKYLNHIRSKFDLPISYRYFDLETNQLSDDY